MNILHLKYAVEVEKTRSINKAAENLFMSQPNLSRAVKELEESLGITIFKRTTKGIEITPQGEEFLGYAKKILLQIDQVEALYKGDAEKKQTFSISVPRASYVSDAFVRFAKEIDLLREAEILYKETNSMRAISNILQSDYNLGIIRFQTAFEKYFDAMLHEKRLKSELVREFSYTAVMSRDNPLAKKDFIEFEDLRDYIEIAHADPYVPSLPMAEARKAELSEFVNKRIFVFERGSQMELLKNVPSTFMWVSPISQETLNSCNLVMKQCHDNKKVYKDLLIYREEYRFSALDELFIKKLNEVKNEY